MTAGADITVIPDDSPTVAGGTISGSFTVINTGNSADVFSLSSVGLSCQMESSVVLQPGESTFQLPYVCNVPEDALAGTNAFSFRAVSTARSDAIHNEVVYTIDATWDANSVASISLADSELSIPYLGGSSTTITITNLANIGISGKITTVGVGDGVFNIKFNNSLGEVTASFTLAPGASEIFVVRFDALNPDATVAEIRIRALIQIDGSGINAESNPLEISVKGEPQPPQGVTLLGVELAKRPPSK